MRALILLAAFLSGCATCERHPTACVVGGAIIAGTAVAMAEAHRGTTLPPPPQSQVKGWYTK